MLAQVLGSAARGVQLGQTVQEVSLLFVLTEIVNILHEYHQYFTFI